MTAAVELPAIHLLVELLAELLRKEGALWCSGYHRGCGSLKLGFYFQILRSHQSLQ